MGGRGGRRVVGGGVREIGKRGGAVGEVGQGWREREGGGEERVRVRRGGGVRGVGGGWWRREGRRVGFK